MTIRLLLLALLSSLLLLGCPTPDDDDSAADDDDAVDDDDSGGSEIPNEWGFDMRIPQEHELDCAGTPVPFWDTDWLCTFDWGAATGVLYLQATPTQCEPFGMSETPTYTIGEAVLSVDDGLVAVDDPLYDFGGNHNNDELRFGHGDNVFRYYHSSFGFGWRKCQPMDCAQVYEADGATLVQDGCTCDRELPVVCVPITTAGTFDELVDTFEVCDGDPECGD